MCRFVTSSFGSLSFNGCFNKNQNVGCVMTSIVNVDNVVAIDVVCFILMTTVDNVFG